MVDIAQTLNIRDVDMRVLIVLSLAIVVNEIGGAYEIISIMTLGILWAFLTTPDSQAIVNSSVYKYEEIISPLTTSRVWKLYGRPICYIAFIVVITGLAIV